MIRQQDLTIQNTHRQDMHIRVLTPDDFNKSRMRVMFHEHGRSGCMDDQHHKAVIKAYLEAGYRVIALDAGNSQNNPSYGALEDFTIEQHTADLIATIDWARKKGLCRTHFALAAHSMGGFSALQIASKLRNSVSHVFAYAPVTDGPKHVQARYDNTPEIVKQWHDNGFIIEPPDETSPKRKTQPQPKLSWKQFQGWQKHSLFPVARNIGAPVMLVAGEKDLWVPPSYMQAFADALPDCRGVRIISKASHGFAENLAGLKAAAHDAIPILEAA